MKYVLEYKLESLTKFQGYYLINTQSSPIYIGRDIRAVCFIFVPNARYVIVLFGTEWSSASPGR